MSNFSEFKFLILYIQKAYVMLLDRSFQWIILSLPFLSLYVHASNTKRFGTKYSLKKKSSPSILQKLYLNLQAYKCLCKHLLSWQIIGRKKQNHKSDWACLQIWNKLQEYHYFWKILLMFLYKHLCIWEKL